ncbi:zinc knuckle protein (macronuclear) [Tetrahymena thermophila SB210]|uniref:Zinc knuckle protein n=1 Tax=Tetrahymena thermophila (strain SB210) TaxID=312017 RepID=I7LX47_TETTS|nr:zinc knuckle protein [Tetrahymena thermophila SB210]EAS03752.2 zinc knuckle protein [Tetrahymena thermophila SB210]|eukprot:XP_001023997.2 zinc knuckle protein [Tetrahymena thermophila SB210]
MNTPNQLFPSSMLKSGIREGEHVRQLKTVDQVRRKSFQDDDILSLTSTNNKKNNKQPSQTIEDLSQVEISRSMDFTKAMDQFSFQQPIDPKIKSRGMNSLLEYNGNLQYRSSIMNKSPNFLIQESADQHENIAANYQNSYILINQSQNLLCLNEQKDQAILNNDEKLQDQANSKKRSPPNAKINLQSIDEMSKLNSPQISGGKDSLLIDSQKLGGKEEVLKQKYSSFKFSFFLRSAKISKFIQLMKQKTNKYLLSNLQNTQFKIINDKASFFIYYVQKKLIKENGDGKEVKSGIFRKLKNYFLKIYLSDQNVIDPDHWFKIIWDLVVIIQIIILTIIIPLKTAFSISYESYFSQNNFVNDLITIYLPFITFFFEIAINFNTAIYKSGQIIKERKYIIKKYFKNKLIYEILIYFIYFISIKEDSLYYLQLVILLRAKKIFELLKQFFNRFDQEQNYYIYTKIIRIVATLLVTCHIVSCIFISVGLTIKQNEDTNWIDKHFRNIGTPITNTSIYVTALYWSVITMITIGYGDVVPINTNEKVFVIFVAFIACGTYAYTFNYIGELVKEIQREQKQSKNKLQKLNRHMNDRGVPKYVMQQVKKYYEYINKENQKNSSDGYEMISNLPQSLKDEVMQELYVKVILQNKLFKLNFSQNFIKELALFVKEIKIGPEIFLYHQNEQLDKLYFVLKGNISLMWKVKKDEFINLQHIKKGDTLGQIELFTEQKTQYFAKTHDVVTLAYITLGDFKYVISKFPDEFEKYHKIKDKANFYQEYQGLDMKCLSCNQYSHQIADCPQLKYQPNIDKITYQYNHSQAQQERSNHERRKRTKINPIFISQEIQNSAYIFQKNNQKLNYQVNRIVQEGISPFHNNTSTPFGTDGEEEEIYNQGNFGNVPDDKKRKSFFTNKNYIRTQTHTEINQSINQSGGQTEYLGDEGGTPINQPSKISGITKAKSKKSLYIQKQIILQLQKEYEQQILNEKKEEAIKLQKQRFPQLAIQTNKDFDQIEVQHFIQSNNSVLSPSLMNNNGGALEIPNLGYFRETSIQINNNSDTNSIYLNRRISANSPAANQNQFEDYFETEQHIQSTNNFNWLHKQQTIQLQPYTINQTSNYIQSIPAIRGRQSSIQNIQIDGKNPLSPRNQSNVEQGSINNLINSITISNNLQQNNTNNNPISNPNNQVNSSTFLTNNSNMNSNQNHRSQNQLSLGRVDTMLGTQYQKILQPTQQPTFNEIGYQSHHEEETNTKSGIVSQTKKKKTNPNIYSHLQHNLLNSPNTLQNRNDFYVILSFDKMKQYTYYFPHNNLTHILKTFRKKQAKLVKQKKIKPKTQNTKHKTSIFMSKDFK